MSEHFLKIVIPIHLLTLFSLILLFFGFVSWHWLIITFIACFFISGLGIAIGFHRLISHSSFKSSDLIRNILAYLGCLGAQGSPVFWASLHNGLHHPFADTVRDLHSPIHGKFNSYIGWQMSLRPEQIPFRIGAKLIREPFFKFLHKNYYPVFWGTVLTAAAISWKFAIFGLIIPGFLSTHQENLIDLFCHLPWAGYRNHDTRDNSVNNFILGFFAFGQGWHNNHHARPNDYNFGGDKWWEIDVCAFIIPLLQKKRLSMNVQPAQVAAE